MEEQDWVYLNWQDHGLGSIHGTGDEPTYDIDEDIEAASYSMWLNDEGDINLYHERMSSNEIRI